MATKTITVTQEDIDLGVQGSGDACSVARAIKRTFKKSTSALSLFVCPRYIFINGKQTNNVEGEFLFNWMMAFDTDKQAVEPFTFELEY